MQNRRLTEMSNETEKLVAENRLLKNMAGVPENYGIDIEKIRLQDRDKIDDYKRLIKVLQQDNYKLEEERAHLKQMMKEQAMIFRDANESRPAKRYRDLTEDQLFQVDAFVTRLKNGEEESHGDRIELKKENEKLRTELNALEKKGYNMLKQQLDEFLDTFSQ